MDKLEALTLFGWQKFVTVNVEHEFTCALVHATHGLGVVASSKQLNLAVEAACEKATEAVDAWQRAKEKDGMLRRALFGAHDELPADVKKALREWIDG